jgi:ABC-type polysaccharide/polyol phosphate transport system ATPase subunit
MGTSSVVLRDVQVDLLVQRHGLSSIKEYLVTLGSKRLLAPRRVLHDIDLEVRAGECFGIVGRNGSGKSTLLRVIAGIIEPTAGTVSVRGRVAPMLALGVGLEPELSGWENVDLCATLLGLDRAGVAHAKAYTRTFSGLSEADLGMQVKRYSTGMTARLGFSIATANDPDVLLVDEVLAVGDAAFQQQCYARIDQLKRAGCTVLFVSHSLGEVQRLCDRAACMEAGTIVKVGHPHEVGVHYHGLLGIPVNA